MARTPSKITKRDIDKDLYLEIVSEASNETNVQKLLDEYVRKDEGIAEWQLPTQYRKNLTQKINALDSDIQGMKNDTTQKDWNADIAKRLAVVEEKEGIKVEGDSGVSPIIGTQVASNTLGISKNSKELDVLKGQFDEFSQKFDVHENKNENDHMKLQIEFNTKLQSASDQMTKLQDSVAKKRDVTEPIKEEDLDDNVRKNMHTILNFGDKTLSALDNLDSFVERISAVEAEAQKASENANSALTKADGILSNVEDSINKRVSEISDTNQKSVENLHTSIEQYKNDSTTSITGMQEQINSLRDKQLKNTTRISEINEKIEDTARSAENNAVNISGNSDRIDELKMNADNEKQAVDNRLDNIQDQLDNMHLFHGIGTGRFISIMDESGAIGGKDLIRCVYLAEDKEQLQELMMSTASPIYYRNADYAFIAKTAEEIQKETEAATQNDPAPKTDTPADSGSTTNPETPGTPSEDTPATDNPAETNPETKDELSTTAEVPAENENASSTDALAESKVAALSEEAGSSEPADSTPSNNDSSQPTTDTPSDSADTPNLSPINTDELGITEYMLKYKGTCDFMKRPENRNVLIYDMYSKTIAAYTDGDGEIRDFYTRPTKEKQYEVVINAGEAIDIVRRNMGSRMSALVLIRDRNQTSPTYDKWINSEGVITIAYSDTAYTLYNNSHEQQQVRVYME